MRRVRAGIIQSRQPAEWNDSNKPKPKKKGVKVRKDMKGEAQDYGVDLKKSEAGLSHKGDPLVSMYNAAEKSAVGSRVRSGSASKNALSIAKAQDIESLYDHSPFTKKDKY